MTAIEICKEKIAAVRADLATVDERAKAHLASTGTQPGDIDYAGRLMAYKLGTAEGLLNATLRLVEGLVADLVKVSEKADATITVVLDVDDGCVQTVRSDDPDRLSVIVSDPALFPEAQHFDVDGLDPDDLAKLTKEADAADDRNFKGRV